MADENRTNQNNSLNEQRASESSDRITSGSARADIRDMIEQKVKLNHLEEMSLDTILKENIATEERIEKLQEIRNNEELFNSLSKEQQDALIEYNKELDESIEKRNVIIEKAKEEGILSEQSIEDQKKLIEKKKQLSKIESEQAELRKKYQKGEIDRKTFMSKIKEVSSRKNSVRADIENINGEGRDRQYFSNNNMLNGLVNMFTDQNKNSWFGRLTNKGEGGSNPLGERAVALLDGINDVTGAIADSLTNVIEGAVKTLTGTYGKINANLEGTGMNIKGVLSDINSSIGSSGLVKQTEYLSKIAELSSQGITNDVESTALLETIKDKTLTSFNGTNNALLRLIRITEDSSLTAQQFGLEEVLKKTLNATFTDSTYLNSLYDTITGAMINAAAYQGGNSTEFYSAVQGWMSAMYEGGVSDSTVQKIASALDSLGSGNVNALSSNNDMQRLLLLSMDRIGMDYADVLQQGIDGSVINDIMTSMVKYLGEIASNTSDNKVLTSAYSNLFSLSMADMKAIQNIQDFGITSVSSSKALSTTENAISKTLANNTMVAEKINNFWDNTKFAFGEGVATNELAYTIFKGANVINNVVDGFLGKDGSTGATGLDLTLKGIKTASNIALITSTFPGLKTAIGSIATGVGNIGDQSNLLKLLDTASGGGGGYFNPNANKPSASALKGLSFMNEQSLSIDGWEDKKAEKTAEEEILETLQSILRTNSANDQTRNAIAVFLEGMSDEALMSYASIFADEDSMELTMNGKNSVLSDKRFFSYADTTSDKNKDGGTQFVK